MGLDSTGKRLHDGPLPNTEPTLRALFDTLATPGPLLINVGQPATIGALPVTVARARTPACLPARPGHAPHRRLYPDTATTDARDAYAGIAPVTHRSGTSVKGEHPARTSNRTLKRAFLLAAFAALSDPPSRAYDDKKRAEGKNHNAALLCRARRRCDVLFAMLRHHTHYQPPEPKDVSAAA